MRNIILKNRDDNTCFSTGWTTTDPITFKAYGSLYNLGKSFDQILVGETFYFRNENVTFIIVQKQEEKTEEGNTMTKEHKGLPVKGYLPQSDEKIALANTNKELEERCLRRIEWFEKENEYHKKSQTVGPLPYDPRMLKLAFTGIQDAFMWMNRSVFQPSRVTLLEDELIPNETTIKAMQNACDGVGMHRVGSVDKLMKELDKD